MNDDQRLIGVVPARRLLQAALDKLISDVMVHNVAAIPDWATAADVATLLFYFGLGTRLLL